MAVISAAVPRLHTLGVFSAPDGVPDAAAVAGFVDDLLPRLHVFEYFGSWPQNPSTDNAATSSAPPPLPLLRTVKLQGIGDWVSPPWTWFMGARLLELRTDDAMIQQWLPPEVDDGGPAEAALSGVAYRPLASVKILQLYVRSPIFFAPTNFTRLLRAAPHLETLIISCVDASWLAHSDFDAGLVHLKLRRIRVSASRHLTSPLTSDSLTRSLRQRHFPRLWVVAINGREHFVTPLELPSFAQTVFTRVVQFVAGLASRLWN
jgi:hypothetical protein